MKRKLKDIWAWLVSSSADPQQAGMLVRGALLWAVAQVVGVAPLLCQWAQFCIDTVALKDIVEPVTGFVVTILTLISYGMMAYGGLRKLWYSRWAHPEVK